MAERLLVPKKKRPKSKWMSGFIITPALTLGEQIESERRTLCVVRREKLVKSLSTK